MTTTAKKIEQDSASATPNPSDWPEWAETAYRAHARGQRNISALSKQFGVGWQTCRDWIRRVGCFMAEQEEQAELEARAEYVAGLEEILGRERRPTRMSSRSRTDDLCPPKRSERKRPLRTTLLWGRGAGSYGTHPRPSTDVTPYDHQREEES